MKMKDYKYLYDSFFMLSKFSLVVSQNNIEIINTFLIFFPLNYLLKILTSQNSRDKSDFN